MEEEKDSSCSMCGKTVSQFYSELNKKIESIGWTVLFAPTSPSFAYTLGLKKSYNHAELFLIGEDYPTSLEILNMIGSSIRDGIKYRPNSNQSLAYGTKTIYFSEFTQNHINKYPNAINSYYQRLIPIILLEMNK